MAKIKILIEHLQKVIGKSCKNKIHFNNDYRDILLIKLKINKLFRKNRQELLNLINFS